MLPLAGQTAVVVLTSTGGATVGATDVGGPRQILGEGLLRTQALGVDVWLDAARIVPVRQ